MHQTLPWGRGWLARLLLPLSCNLCLFLGRWANSFSRERLTEASYAEVIQLLTPVKNNERRLGRRFHSQYRESSRCSLSLWRASYFSRNIRGAEGVGWGRLQTEPIARDWWEDLERESGSDGLTLWQPSLNR